MLYNLFFLLSLHSHLGIFHPYVVVRLSLGFSSNSRDFGIYVSINAGLLAYAINHYRSVENSFE